MKQENKEKLKKSVPWIIAGLSAIGGFILGTSTSKRKISTLRGENLAQEKTINRLIKAKGNSDYHLGKSTKY